ncbi:hypothetical protein FRX31_018629 [Thalictrum thalictroides]|uniref:Uncharacterized protein n=1 Tax=Thalictrum thalictroides TaxID=46969 RepID=A0A7J6W330_THATH|nr:hypothetical protein FRX31_018629 [Thalictrum thalictroides]
MEQWWNSFIVEGPPSYRWWMKMKNLKGKLRVWNNEVFGKVDRVIEGKVAAIQNLDIKAESEDLNDDEETYRAILKHEPAGPGKELGKKVLELLPYVTVWILWKVRNGKVFEQKERSLVRICNEIKGTIWYWLGTWEQRRNFIFQDLLLNWGAVINGDIG